MLIHHLVSAVSSVNSNHEGPRSVNCLKKAVQIEADSPDLQSQALAMHNRLKMCHICSKVNPYAVSVY